MERKIIKFVPNLLKCRNHKFFVRWLNVRDKGRKNIYNYTIRSSIDFFFFRYVLSFLVCCTSNACVTTCEWNEWWKKSALVVYSHHY